MKFSSELLKGTAELLVLQILAKHGESYGYELVRSIAESSNNVFEFQEGTLYPLLYRLEARGFIGSEEKLSPTGKKRRYYSITSSGAATLKVRRTELGAFVQGLSTALDLAV